MTTPPSAPRVFDPSPLTDPVDPAAARAWAPGFRRAQGLQDGLPNGVVAGIVLASILGGLPVLFGLVVVVAFPVATVVLVLAGLAVAGLCLGIAIPVGYAQRAKQEQHWYRMAGFANRNGVEYIAQIDRPQLPGMVFQLGDNRRTVDALRGTDPRFVEFGDYSYTITTSNGKTTQTTTYRWGYVAIRLDVPLPNIVLDAVGNNGIFGSNLPARFDRHQQLSLEGDFDRWFTLYCPQGYETDALYLFTPDVMARCIDHAAQLDVEIVDDWLILYHQGGFPTESPETWAWLFGVVGTMLEKLSRWGRWRDERLALAAASGPTPPDWHGAQWADAAAPLPAAAPMPAAPAAHLPFAAPDSTAPPRFPPPLPFPRRPIGVAQPGRRLKRRFPLAAIIVLSVVLAATFVVPMILVVVGVLVSR